MWYILRLSAVYKLTKDPQLNFALQAVMYFNITIKTTNMNSLLYQYLYLPFGMHASP